MCEKACCPLGTGCGTVNKPCCDNVCGTSCCKPKEDCCGDTECCPPDRECCGEKCCPEGEGCVRGKCEKICKTETARGVSRVYNPETQCCTEGGIEPKYPIRYFTLCEKTRVARKGYKPTSNGCGPEGGPKLPDSFGKASFLAVCNKHDLCYGKCRSDRKACDRKFCQGIKAACQKAYPKAKSKMRIRCDNRAELYCDGVTALGSLAYDDAQSKACQCCP